MMAAKQASLRMYRTRVGGYAREHSRSQWRVRSHATQELQDQSLTIGTEPNACAEEQKTMQLRLIYCNGSRLDLCL